MVTLAIHISVQYIFCPGQDSANANNPIHPIDPILFPKVAMTSIKRIFGTQIISPTDPCSCRRDSRFPTELFQQNSSVESLRQPPN
jgi:hypothetical protein